MTIIIIAALAITLIAYGQTMEVSCEDEGKSISMILAAWSYSNIPLTTDELERRGISDDAWKLFGNVINMMMAYETNCQGEDENIMAFIQEYTGGEGSNN